MQYNCIPVFSNVHLVSELKKLDGNPFVRSLLFINCGGLIDQTTQWYYTADSRVQTFIFDSHRPFHHSNIIDQHRKIYIIHDGCKSFDKYPTAEDVQILQELAEEEDDEDEYGDETDRDEDDEEIKEELEDLKDNGSDDEEEVYGERVDRKGDDEENGGEIIGADEDIDEMRVGVKRPRGEKDGEAKIDKRALKRQKRALFQRYYSGTFYYKCCAHIMYSLHQELNRENNDSLWYWIIAMTDLQVHQRSGIHELDQDMIDCTGEVHRLNPNIYNR